MELSSLLTSYVTNEKWFYSSLLWKLIRLSGGPYNYASPMAAAYNNGSLAKDAHLNERGS